MAELKKENGKKRPNVLWIQTDEHRPDSLGCYGSDWARTPNLDKLATRGAVFHECHVQSPTCVPSRTSMLTCKYPQELNVLENSPAFRDGFLGADEKLIPNLFADAGYQTASIGKWHTPNHPTWETNQQFILHEDGPVGFYDLAEGCSEEEHRVVKRPGGTSIIMGGIYPEHDGGTNLSSHVTDLAVDWLKENASLDGQPFFLRVSHLWPHTPVLLPKEWDGFYRPDEVPCRSLNRRVYLERSEYDREFSDGHRGFDLSIDTWHQVCADYYGLCSYVDFEVGRLLEALEELGLAENTIIAFNADHGKNLGEAGLCEKNTFDREVWRVPFILSLPGVVPEGEHRHDLMELMDFGPTVCSLAGIEPAEGMRGRDLFNSAEPEAVFGIVETCEEWGRRWIRAGVRTCKYRYDCTFMLEGDPLPEDACGANLFDLEADPYEENNLIDRPEMKGVAAELYHKVYSWYQRYPAEAE